MNLQNFNNLRCELFSLLEEIKSDFKLRPEDTLSVYSGLANWFLVLEIIINNSLKGGKISKDIINKQYHISQPPTIKEIFYDKENFSKLPKDIKSKFIKDRKINNPLLSNRKLGRIFNLSHKTIKEYLEYGK